MKGNNLTVRAIDKGIEFTTTSSQLHELDKDIAAIPALVFTLILISYIIGKRMCFSWC